MPIEASDAPASNPRTTDDAALQTAWARFLDYEHASEKSKPTQVRIREWIIFLSLLATILSIAYSTLPADANTELRNLMRGVLFLLPLILSGILAWALQFMPSTAWIAYRVGAELIGYHIYLYRARAGEYLQLGEAERQETLVNRLVETRQRVDDMGVSTPYIALAERDLLATVKANLLREQKGVANPKNPIHIKDDGFTELDVNAYIQVRVLPRRYWYVRRLQNDWSRLKFWRAAVLGCTGAGAALVFFGHEPWLAVMTAASVAASLFIDLHMYGRTYSIYHMTVMRIDEELARWQSLPMHKRDEPAEQSVMIETMEKIFKEERDRWMEQAMQAQQVSEQGLIKSANLTNSPYDFVEKTNADLGITPREQQQHSDSTPAAYGQASWTLADLIPHDDALDLPMDPMPARFAYAQMAMDGATSPAVNGNGKASAKIAIMPVSERYNDSEPILPPSLPEVEMTRE